MAKYKKPPKPGEQQPSILANIVGGLAAVVGVAVGNYATFALLVPGVTALVIGLTLAAFLQPPRKSFAGAVALQFGHGTWMLVGLVLAGALAPQVVGDRQSALLLLAEALALLLLPWFLLFVPPLIPAIPLMLLHTLGLATNGMAFFAAQPGTAVHQALLVHIVFRAGAIIALIVGLVAWYSQPTDEERERDRDRDEDESDVELVEEEERPRRRAEDDDRDPPRRQERRERPTDRRRHPDRPYREEDD